MPEIVQVEIRPADARAIPVPCLLHHVREQWTASLADEDERVRVRTDDALIRRVAPASGFGLVDLDGAALAYYSSHEAMLRILGDPDVSGRLMEDERTFIDHSSSALVCGWSR